MLEALTFQFNQRNVIVYAIGTFVFQENVGVEKITQVLPDTDETYPGTS